MALMSSAPREPEMKQDIERISAGLSRLLEEIETLLDATADGTGEKMQHADLKSRELLQRVTGHLRQARSEVVGRARKIDGAVHSNPWRALALTAVVSFVAGLLVRRR
jgi:ElaB/YqjD/DUF883 family membrane-anchored ribosome-binding protein